ncbi:serine/threonine protein kinase [Methylobacillus glycogenes]|uniref:serine/threonine protein kinase n=1 Tax=Methylobacillus glycogenes TaxID=406 RepID=UPI000470BFBB|nr:serine/threonine-protein kinase [Methylobacillus glycogenes]MBL8505515.1 serine/threonine protein kinase [Methylobacillus glycogenes]
MHANQNSALPPGYQLQGYEIKKLLSSGGFSFVYIARDQQEQTTVAVKEYLPNILALRQSGDQVRVPTNETMAGFRFGLKCFFEEGRALANINHPNIVRVLNFFRANETVYMVMQYERGKSLQECILSKNEPMAEPKLRSIFSQLLNGLREVHAQKLLHLDIKPANIYIRRDGSPVLLDFGSARMALSEETSQLPPSYTPGFASPEQYRHHKELGPWSDVYSVGASMYACLLQASPQAADQRMKNDQLTSAVKLGKGIYSPQLLAVIDSCLALDPMDRPPSVFALQKSLMEEVDYPTNDGWFNRIAAFLNQDIIK